jgi:peptidoglycan hydrolase-like protein with peptidoglycan-binding domain
LRYAIFFLALCLAGSGDLGAAARSAKSKHHTTAARSSKKKKKRSRPRRTSARWRRGQMQPTPERYKEIQEALAKKGYLHGDPTGVWDQQSADALRRFQQDQNLDPSGKLNSLSIIALGLGPKYEVSPAPNP